MTAHRIPGIIVTSSIIDDLHNGPVDTVWQVLAEDPLAFTLVFSEGGDSVDWTISRSILDECLDTGSSNPDPQGDVYMWLQDGKLRMTLSSPDGTALIEFPDEEVYAFRSEADLAVPNRIPDAAMDEFLAGLLDGPA